MSATVSFSTINATSLSSSSISTTTEEVRGCGAGADAASVVFSKSDPKEHSMENNEYTGSLKQGFISFSVD